MADKAISQLNAATSVNSLDLFVLEQSGEAKKLTGQILENWLVSFADGHGGIQSISKTSTTGTNPVIDTYTIVYADETTSTFTVTNGIKGDTGAQTYVWIKYSENYPTADSDMSSSPDNWMGIYAGTASSAPAHYTDYVWFEIKGETGETGAAATITAATVGYQQSDSGAVVPEGSWTTTVPSPVAGKFLWTRIQIQFNTGSPITAYSVSRYGIDGSGAVASVNNVSPDQYGNVQLVAGDIQALDSQSVQAHLDDDEQDIADLKTSLSTVKSDLGIVEDTNTATHTIAQGQYVIWKDALYKASQAIPIGTTLSSSNLTAVSGGGLNALSVGYGAGETITLSSTVIQATKDGMLVVNVDPGGSYIATYYVNDNTIGVTYVATSLAGAGSQATIAVPWIKGHNYRNTYKANASTINLTLYPFEIK